MLNKDQNVIEKKRRLAQIKEAVRNLKDSPLYAYRVVNNYQPVVGEGDPDAKIMMIGEAPGEKEARTGQPFVGRAGQFLDELLQSINLKRENVYITNILKDRPPKNRDPQIDEITCYTPILIEQINIIDPKVIVTLGRFAMNFILKQFSLPESGSKIGDLHGKVLKTKTGSQAIRILPLYHPAAVFYNRKLEETVQKDFQKLSWFIE